MLHLNQTYAEKICDSNQICVVKLQQILTGWAVVTVLVRRGRRSACNRRWIAIKKCLDVTINLCRRPFAVDLLARVSWSAWQMEAVGRHFRAIGLWRVDDMMCRRRLWMVFRVRCRCWVPFHAYLRLDVLANSTESPYVAGEQGKCDGE